MSDRTLGLRSQILLILLCAAILPLGVVGVWLTRSAIRSGESLLRTHLDESADRLAELLRARWQYRAADIALITENESSRRAVAGLPLRNEDSVYLGRLAFELERTIPTVALRDGQGRTVWSTSPATRQAELLARGGANGGPSAPAGPVVRLERPVGGPDAPGQGRVVVEVSLAALLPADAARPAVPGGALAVRGTGGQGTLLPLAPRIGFPDRDRLVVRDTTWLLARRLVPDAPLEIAMGAPLTPYLSPFARVARIGLAALAIVMLFAILLTLLLATRATRPLRALVAASDAITRGELDRRASLGGPREIRRVGQAFNLMTEHLRGTLEQLSRKSALEAVGEFATSLSHDVRNALTAIKVDLERTERRRLQDPLAETLVTRALNNVARLEAAVTGALRIARRGHTPQVEVDLRETLKNACATVDGAFAAVPASLRLQPDDDGAVVRGDAQALEQLFTNLLFNAAQAVSPGGEARVDLVRSPDWVTVSIADTGIGMTDTQLEQLETPFFSSKPGGNGMGLPIARRIAAGHGGELSLQSAPGRGTTVLVKLPRLNGSTVGRERIVPPGGPLQTDLEGSTPEPSTG
jgi:signal transduction histidine kinase